MTVIYSSPGKYIQGPGVLKNLGLYVRNFGKKALIIVSSGGKKRFGRQLEESLSDAECSSVTTCFDGECSEREIAKLTVLVLSENCDMVVGVGGGKILDAAKAAAHYAGLPVIVCPTAVSTDAPCSALTAIYSEDGVFMKYLQLRRNPEIVVMDTSVIAAGPLRLTVAGMGDALSTWFEARACTASGAATPSSVKTGRAALALAEQCHDILMKDGLDAKKALEQHQCIDAAERVIEAVTLLSGIGFESGGLAAAHAIHNGFTALEDCRGMLHGELVAFGTLVQLALENTESPGLVQTAIWCVDLGLPVTLEEMGVIQEQEEKARRTAQVSCEPGSSMFNMPFPVTPELVYQAIMKADSVGRKVRKDSEDIC